MNPKLSGYLNRMEQKYKDLESSQNTVYQLEQMEKSKYDLTHPDYRQKHCLRVEIDRKGIIKITDIDFFLEGNRHAKAQAENISKVN